MGAVVIGQRFGRLTVDEFSHKDARWRKWWMCKCDCGGSSVLHTGNLRSGNTRSCGCLARGPKPERAKPGNAAQFNQLRLQYKRHARDRGLEFDLSVEEMREIMARHCHYCGVPPSNLKKSKSGYAEMKYSGIDRVDSSLGYCTANVVACCAVCNYAKRDMGVKEFADWARRIGSMAEQWG